MARFRAFGSDSSSSSEDENEIHDQQKDCDIAPPISTELQEEKQVEEENNSDIQDEELFISPSRRKQPNKNERASFETEDEDDPRDEQEIPGSPSSSRSSSPFSMGALNVSGDPTLIPWARHIGVDAEKMHVMQTSLFRMPEQEAALRQRAMEEGAKARAVLSRLNFRGKRAGNRKRSRDSDGDGLRLDSLERTSFGQNIDSPVFRPTRKYARVAKISSIANKSEGAYVDAGLSMGRSFRVGWGASGKLVHLGVICGPLSTTNTSANTSAIKITNVLPAPFIHQRDSTVPQTLLQSTVAGKLLQHHLSHTTIAPDEEGIPRAYPSPPQSTSTASISWQSHGHASTSEPLNFASFVPLFPSSENFSSSPGPIFNLGSALFDPIDLHLSNSKPVAITEGSVITPSLRNFVTLLRRKRALSKWLEEVVKPSVDGDLRSRSNGSNATYTAADAAFSHLTGHQISQACTTAADGGYLKLSTLISSAGGDNIFKEDIQAQLQIWKSEKMSPGSNSALTNAQHGLVGRGVWKVYRLLGGLMEQSESDIQSTDDLYSGLDWKRVFGICLWYGTSIESSVASVIGFYERILQQSAKNSNPSVARPISKWAPSQPSTHLGLLANPASTKDNVPEDPLYSLIRLHADSTLSLSHILNPLSFASSGLDWGIAMCWHLYIILSRVMKVRDFADRGKYVPKEKPHHTRRSLVNGIVRNRANNSIEEDVDDEALRPDGHSPTADLLTSSYAFELESWGMVQEAAFVLMHLEGSAGREKALKDLLARSAPKINDFVYRGLFGSLKLPMTWVDEAKAMHEYDCGRFYSAYELFVQARSYNAAHNIAVLDLAPDAIIRKDLRLLHNLFVEFDSPGKREKIENWLTRGKILLEYIDLISRLPKLMEETHTESEDGSSVIRTEEIDTLSKRIPNIIGLLPDIFRLSDDRHVAAVEEMTKDLIKLAEKAQPVLLSRIQPAVMSTRSLDGATKISLARGIGIVRFLKSIEV